MMQCKYHERGYCFGEVAVTPDGVLCEYHEFLIFINNRNKRKNEDDYNHERTPETVDMFTEVNDDERNA